MKAYHKKCDSILYYLKEALQANWNIFSASTGIEKSDAVLVYLKEYGLINFDEETVCLSEKGRNVVSSGSILSFTNRNVKPISEHQQELLMECHERLLLKQELVSTYYTRYATGLLKRGLIEVKTMYRNQRPIEVFSITDKGIRYLEEKSDAGV